MNTNKNNKRYEDYAKKCCICGTDKQLGYLKSQEWIMIVCVKCHINVFGKFYSIHNHNHILESHYDIIELKKVNFCNGE